MLCSLEQLRLPSLTSSHLKILVASLVLRSSPLQLFLVSPTPPSYLFTGLSGFETEGQMGFITTSTVRQFSVLYSSWLWRPAPAFGGLKCKMGCIVRVWSNGVRVCHGPVTLLLASSFFSRYCTIWQVGAATLDCITTIVPCVTRDVL